MSMRKGWMLLLAVWMLLAASGCATMFGGNGGQDQGGDGGEGKQEAKQAKPDKPDKKKKEGQDQAGKEGGGRIRMQAGETKTPMLAGGPEEPLREPKPMTLSDLRKKYPSTFVFSGSGDQREVALTFDDAPDDIFTPLVLDALKQEGVKATFFCVGNRIEAHPDVMRRIVAEGHIVGNHSYSHPNLPKLSDEKFRAEIQKTDKLIKQYTGYTPSFVRPPYGNISEEQIKWLASQKRRIVNWNVDSLDWKNLTRDQVTVNVLADVQPGSIILQHSGGGIGQDLTGTVEALPEIVAKLKADGVRFVTVPHMLGIPQ